MSPAFSLRFISFLFSLGLVLSQIPDGVYTRELKVGQDKVDLLYDIRQGTSGKFVVSIGVTCNGKSIPQLRLPLKRLSGVKHEVLFGGRLKPFMDDVKAKCKSLQIAPDDFEYVIYTVGKAVQIQLQGKPLMLYLK